MEYDEMTEQFLRLPAVASMVGWSKITIHRAVKDGRFPKPVKLGARSIAWPESEIIEWQEARKAERDQVAA
jgi:prophage regulatory protein